MSANTEPDAEQVPALGSTPKTPTPLQPPATLNQDAASTTLDPTCLASSSFLTPLAEATAAVATSTSASTPQLEQASVSSTPATRTSSSGWDQHNDGDDEQSDDHDKDQGDDDDDMYEDDVILPVELTVVPGHLAEAIPDEIWCLLLSFVPPAKLITLNRVSRRWKLMIEQDLIVSYWRPLVIQTEILDRDDYVTDDGDSLKMPIGLIKTFPELVLGHALAICELCLTRSKRGCGSAVPLPVDRQDTLGRVWMCRPCRRDYYERYPEPERTYKREDSISLYGLPGHPPKVVRSTGPPVPRRTYFSRHNYGSGFRSSRYYNDYDSFDEYMSSSDFDEYGSDESGGMYFATEADLEEDDRWTREADAREAAAEAAKANLKAMGEESAAGQVVRGDDNEKAQGTQETSNVKSVPMGQIGNAAGSVRVDGLTSREHTETKDTVETEGEQTGQISDTATGVASTDDGYEADGEPESKVVTDTEGTQIGQGGEAFGAAIGGEPVYVGEPDHAAVEPDEEEEQVDEEAEEEEDDEEMASDESSRSDDDEDEEEEEDAPQTAGNQATTDEARRHHGGDIGIQAHSNSSTQLRIRLQPLRNRMMRTRLGMLGLTLRTDSKLCQDYLNGLMDDPFKIADVMKEMQWYFAATDYPSLIEDNDSSTAKSAAMEAWVESAIEEYGDGAKNWYRGLHPDEDPADVEVNVMDQMQPPKRLWRVLDEWIDRRLKGDLDYTPPDRTFAVNVRTDDLQD
ncbi:hypothetical protein BGW39_005969 [Mortierella sp. 14UC]|nr:hypothetical protein BGW39_005969 [Mortierella sp. 14UC]